MAAFKTYVFQPAEPEPTRFELGIRGYLPSTQEKIYTQHFKKDLKKHALKKDANLIWWNRNWTNKGFQTVSEEALEDVITNKVGEKFKYPPWLRTKCTLALREKKNFLAKSDNIDRGDEAQREAARRQMARRMEEMMEEMQELERRLATSRLATSKKWMKK